MSDADNINSGGGVRAVTRALEILLAFESKNDLTVAELMERVPLSKATLYRLLYTLESMNFITSSDEPLRFRLGPAFGVLSKAWLSGVNLEVSAEPFLRSLREETQETVALHVPEGKDRLCLLELPSPQPLNFRRGAGFRTDLWKGASGRAILVGMHPTIEELTLLVDDPQTDINALFRELQETERRGYACSRSELIEGAVAIAVPIFDRTSRVVGALSVYGPSIRLGPQSEKKIGQILKMKALELSRAIGYP